MANPPELWFIPAENVLHPETLQPIMEVGVAYSLEAFKLMCRETGIDYADGRICTLESARVLRSKGNITKFTLLKTEDR